MRMSTILSSVAIFISLLALFKKPSMTSTSLVATAPALSEQELFSIDPNAKFENKIINLVEECVSYNDNLSSKNEILDLLQNVRQNRYYMQTGSDDFRSKFVHSQATFEHVMACSQALGDITRLVGVIHTPTPTTPLCIEPQQKISEGILDKSIRWDIDKLLTVRSRAQIVREYLMKGGHLYVAYPKGGLEKRTEEQRSVYLNALNQFKGCLFDSVLSCNEMHPEMIGATYLFKNNYNQIYAFSIKARQANDVQKLSEWGIWFGEIKETAVKKRVDIIFDYLKYYDGPDLREDPYLYST